MKPIKITMTAFGPYKKQQVIDFREIEDYQLFVISGKTGAGKTTIFDAICFALYGEANGEDRREPKLLRSDFADDDTHTAVELEFELRGRVYRVERELPHVKQGRKTPSGGKVALYELTSGTAVPCLDKFYKRDVDRKLVEIIGLDKDQFSQIVMLPQGEFRKLLTSETDNKEQILRRIFKTDSFKMISELLDQRRKAAMRKAQDKRAQLDAYIGHIRTTLERRDESPLFETLDEEHYSPQQVIDGLSVEIDDYLSRDQTIQQQVDEAHSVYKQKEANVHTAQALNARFDQLEHYSKQLNVLETRAEEMKTKEERLKQAEKASLIAPYERQSIESEKIARQREALLNEKTIALQTAQSELEQAERHYEIEEQREEQREEMKRKARQLEEWLPVVAQLDQKSQVVNRLEREWEEGALYIKRQDERIQSLKTKVETREKEIQSAEQEVQQLPLWQKKEMDAAAKLKAVQQHVDTLQKYGALQSKEAEEKGKFERLQRAYEQREAEWLAGQASLLAQTLRAGDCCPVCGSLDHPNKAEREGETPTKDQLDQLKAERDRRYYEHQQTLATLVALEETLRQEREQLEQWEVSLDHLQAASEQADAERTESASFSQRLEGTQRQLTERRADLRDMRDQLSQSETERASAAERHQSIALQLTKERTELETGIASIPEEVRALERLREKLDNAKQLIAQWEASWNEARERYQQAQLKKTRAESEQQNAREQSEEANRNAIETKRVFEQERALAGFQSETEYGEAKLETDQREQLRDEIERYRTTIHTLRAQKEELADELTGQQRLDLDQLKEEARQWSERYHQLLKESNRLMKTREDAVKLKKQISKTYDEYIALEENSQLIVHLHDLTRGDNEYRLSFERYLQIAYLESIIEAANARLRKMTNGQFQLDRRTDREARGRQSGLGLDVLDAYTGQYRDVKSLSGGEKFKASLCLALGLSDVIQAHDGGVSIGTMFIDEGFGSLDEESLQEAIDILIELQKSGRTIGVISHVQELKDAIPAVLEVRKTREGYSSARFIVR